MCWFHGFMLHLIITDKSEIHDFYLTKANGNDRSAKVMMAMTQEFFGYLMGDKSYTSPGFRPYSTRMESPCALKSSQYERTGFEP